MISYNKDRFAFRQQFCARCFHNFRHFLPGADAAQRVLLRRQRAGGYFRDEIGVVQQHHRGQTETQTAQQPALDRAHSGGPASVPVNRRQTEQRRDGRRNPIRQHPSAECVEEVEQEQRRAHAEAINQ